MRSVRKKSISGGRRKRNLKKKSKRRRSRSRTKRGGNDDLHAQYEEVRKTIEDNRHKDSEGADSLMELMNEMEAAGIDFNKPRPPRRTARKPAKKKSARRR